MPTTTGIATEFIQFSRTSNATVTDSDGFIKWAPHNFLLNSESFDTASWAKTTTTVAANSIAAPNGTTTADTLTAAGANSTTLQSYTALAVPYTFGVWLRRKTGTGTIQIAADSGTYTTVTITSSWALYTVTQTPVAGTISAGIQIVTSADEVYAWGAHLYRTDLSMQANTSAYPTYNPTTPKNLLGFTESFDNAGWGKTRVLAFGSGSVSNAIVNPVNGLQTADLITEDTSLSNTHFVSQGTSFGWVTGGKYTMSAYIRPNGRNWVRLNVYTDRDYLVYFDVANGTVGTAVNAMGDIVPVGNGWYRCVMQFTIAVGVGGGACYVFLSDADNSVVYNGNGTSGIYLWGAQISDSASLDPYFPSYSTAPTAAAYYGPRRDFDGSTLACKGLLVEEQRTNVLRYTDRLEISRSLAVTGVTGTFANGETVTATGGGTGTYILSGSSSSIILVKGGSGIFSGTLTGGTSAATATISSSSDVWELFDTTISENVISSPDGTTNADKIVETATTANHVAREVISNANAAYTFSIFLKAAERTRAFVSMSDLATGGASIGIDLSTGLTFPTGLSVGSWTSISSSVVPYSNGWYRVTISGTRGAGTSTAATVTLVSTGTTTNYLGVVGSGIYAYGGQLEAGSFATSYVPAVASAFQRNPDVASVSPQAFPYNQAEGTVVVNAAFLAVPNPNSSVAWQLRNDGTNRIIALRNPNTLGFRHLSFVGGSAVGVVDYNVTQSFKDAFAYKADDYAGSTAGAAVVTDPTGAVPPAAVDFNLGNNAGSSDFLNGHIRQITYLPRRVSNAELQARST